MKVFTQKTGKNFTKVRNPTLLLGSYDVVTSHNVRSTLKLTKLYFNVELNNVRQC